MKRIRPIYGRCLSYAGLLFVLGLSGCGTGGHVSIAHVLSPHPDALKRYKSLRDTFLTVRTTPQGLRLPDGRYTPVAINSDILARHLDARLNKATARVAAYHTFKDPKEKSFFAKKIAPSGTLFLTFEEMALDEGQASQLQFRGIIHAVLRGHPEDDVLHDGRLEVEMAGVMGTEADPVKWFHQNQENILSQVADGVMRQILPFEAKDIKRVYYFDPSSQDSARAFGAAVDGDWDMAESLWKFRVETGDGSWQEAYNLGVAAERRRDYANARHYYEIAQMQSKMDEKASQIEWDVLFNTLSQSLTPPASGYGASSSWFTDRLAILPFHDNSGSDNGGSLIRRRLYKSLQEAGYNVLPPEEVDARLKKRKLLKGAKVKLIQPGVMARHAGADKLFFGRIATFKSDSGGGRGTPRIEGLFSMWDKSSRSWIWSVDEGLPQFDIDLFAKRILETLPKRVK